MQKSFLDGRHIPWRVTRLIRNRTTLLPPRRHRPCSRLRKLAHALLLCRPPSYLHHLRAAAPIASPSHPRPTVIPSSSPSPNHKGSGTTPCATSLPPIPPNNNLPPLQRAVLPPPSRPPPPPCRDRRPPKPSYTPSSEWIPSCSPNTQP